ncbi:MAG: nuclear pore complex subunit [Bacteroides sp. SM23_62_1]|nr:MAG: nuclear pore complex subunit [Bacteroides sp. SM23_62_1]
MEPLKIDKTDDTPQVILDVDNEFFEIAGRSLPEDVNTFYEPVLRWIEEYAHNPAQKTVFNFKLTYFNTASSKVILDILTMFEEMIEEGHDVLVKWFYLEDDEDMQEAGMEYSEMIRIPFEIISY